MRPRDVEDADAKETEPFAMEATPAMCHYCFDVLVHELLPVVATDETRKNKHPPSLEFFQNVPESACTPLFVTWEKKQQQQQQQQQHYSLRGCIGTLSPRPLATAIGEYALLAALKDRRFDPIRPEELPYLRVGVSLLVNYEPCDHIYDWEVGVHGILIKFTVNPNAEYSATYLPEVAKEQRWTQHQTLQSLIRKAGYDGPLHDELLARIHCTRYQSSKCRVTYQEYVKYVDSDPSLLLLAPNTKRWCLTS